MTLDELVQARDAFYKMQDWSLTTGAPSEALLARLDMDDLVIGAASI